MSRVFSTQRVGLLMRHDLATQSRNLIIALSALAGTTVVFYLFATLGEAGRGFHEALFANILFLGGYIVTSMAFSDLHDPRGGIAYVMLPGSTYEKYVARLLLSSVGWTIGIVIVYASGTLVGLAIASIFGATGSGVFLPVGRTVWASIGSYLVTQSVFLFGSIYFRKIAFLKTALAGFVVVFTLAVLYLIAARFAFHELFAILRVAGDLELGPDTIRVTGAGADAYFATLDRIRQVLTWVILPVLFWVLGVMRLRETEV